MNKLKDLIKNFKSNFKKNLFANKNNMYANPIKRTASFIVDLIILIFVFNIFINIASYYNFDVKVYKEEIKLETNKESNESVALNKKIDKNIFKKVNFFFLLLSSLYFSFFLSSKKQATIGNQIFKIMVIHTKNGKVTFLTGFMRYTATILNNSSYFLGYILYFFTKDKVFLQDVLSDTRIVNTEYFKQL